MRPAVVWLSICAVQLTMFATSSLRAYDWPSLRPASSAKRTSDMSVRPRLMPSAIMSAAANGELARPAPLLVQDVDREGRVRILREVYLRADGLYINEGRYREVDLSQRLVREGSFTEGRKDGHWVQIHRRPLPPLFREAPYSAFQSPFYSEADFQEGQLHGVWRIFDADRQLVSEIHFADGRRHGTAKWMHPGGVLLREAQFVHGAPHGASKVYSREGQLVSREDFDAGRRLFAETEFYPDQASPQRAGFYLDGHLRAISPDNWERCELARFQPVGERVKHGVYTKWHANGAKSVQGEFVANQPRGKFTWWYESGQARTEGEFVDGQPAGNWRWWREDGTLQMEGGYQNGKPEGEWQLFDENGKPQTASPRLLSTPNAARLLRETVQ